VNSMPLPSAGSAVLTIPLACPLRPPSRCEYQPPFLSGVETAASPSSHTVSCPWFQQRWDEAVQEAATQPGGNMCGEKTASALELSSPNAPSGSAARGLGFTCASVNTPRHRQLGAARQLPHRQPPLVRTERARCAHGKPPTQNRVPATTIQCSSQNRLVSKSRTVPSVPSEVTCGYGVIVRESRKAFNTPRMVPVSNRSNKLPE